MKIITDEKIIDEILSQGVEEVLVKADLKKKLLSGKKIRLYLGIDPTGARLHLGHAVVLWKLKAFQDLGHEVILLIGDFTAKIGDPTGRDAMRVPLSDNQIKENFKDHKKQASKVLDFTKVKIQNNAKWLAKLGFAKILELSSHFTVQQMLHREMFDRRMKEGAPISLNEFMYPLMQGYDSVAMDVDLEVGGNDQMFNMLAGRTLQKIYNHKDKDILTLKILEGMDGRKMSKTFNNAIYLNDEPNEMFGKVMSIKDEFIEVYADLCLPNWGKLKPIWLNLSKPRDQKAWLAKEIVTLYHGEKAGKRAEEEFNNVFGKKEAPADIETFVTDKKMYPPLDLLCDTGLAASKNEAKRLIEQGAIVKIVDGQEHKITDWKQEIGVTNGMIVRRGGRQFKKIILK